MTQGGRATPPPAGALGKESPLYGVPAGSQEVQRQTLLSLSSLQRFLQRGREIAGLERIVARYGAQRPFPELGVGSKSPGRGDSGGHSNGRGGAGRARPRSPTQGHAPM